MKRTLPDWFSALKYQGFSLAVIAAIVLNSCGDGHTPGQEAQIPPSPADLRASIESLEKEISSATDTLKRSKAEQLLSQYIDYSNRFHEDTLSGEYLLRAASLADGIGQYNQAVELLLNFYDGFPASGRRAEAAYLIAFIYDAHIGDKEKAATYYQAVLDRHPDTHWAMQAGSALQIVNLSDEELIEFLEKRQ